MPAVRRDPQHAPVVLAERRGLLPSLRDDELTAWRKPQVARELAHVGRLRKGIREQLVHVRFTIAVGVAQTPDAVLVEDVYLLIADSQRQRLVQARGETPPSDRAGRFVQPADHPDIPVEGHSNAGSVSQKLDVPHAEVTAPRILHRQRHVIDDVWCPCL